MPKTPQTVAEIRSAALSPLEAAKALGIHRQTVYMMLKRGDLHGFRLGRQIRIPAADVAAMVGVGALLEQRQKQGFDTPSENVTEALALLLANVERREPAK